MNSAGPERQGAGRAWGCGASEANCWEEGAAPIRTKGAALRRNPGRGSRPAFQEACLPRERAWLRSTLGQKRSCVAKHTGGGVKGCCRPSRRVIAPRWEGGLGDRGACGRIQAGGREKRPPAGSSHLCTCVVNTHAATHHTRQGPTNTGGTKRVQTHLAHTELPAHRQSKYRADARLQIQVCRRLAGREPVSGVGEGPKHTRGQHTRMGAAAGCQLLHAHKAPKATKPRGTRRVHHFTAAVKWWQEAYG
ncbi:MAG: hypothetical protein J3K34DRAFT_411438 [Monoraphidium minutum]|nr:MAG: hypothetical protein J3K34DRAFT_411438 [Monoraphidium minutum]